MSLVVACGRTSITASVPPDVAVYENERCNGRDDDGDGRVDEGFRDMLGRYNNDTHCGSCDHDCNAPIQHAEAQGCGLLEELPTCLATRCEPGYGLTQSGRCAALGDRLCLPCESASDCGALRSAVCLTLATGHYCSVACSDSCPDGYRCQQLAADRVCLPMHGDCGCSDAGSFTRACARSAPDGGSCVGAQLCSEGQLASCEPAAERCDGTDDDCDGLVDEGFVDDLGAYSLDTAHCGMCGVDCEQASAEAGMALTCGGDAFAPSCVLACPELADGLQIGDRVDADRRLDTGCECVVQSVVDREDDAGKDENCDGADGDVLRSFYVASDGDDAGPGSPTRPFASIDHAVAAAAASLTGERPRPSVYIASGTYTEVVHVVTGVRVHGGYRRDYLARNPASYVVLVAAPPTSASEFGAGLVIDAAGEQPTLVEGLTVRGFDAADGQPALAVRVHAASAALTLRGLRLHSGKPGSGRSGQDAVSMTVPAADGGPGEPPRAAVEGAGHACRIGAVNQTVGGAGGQQQCGDVDVSGGPGGGGHCPQLAAAAADGEPGRGSAPGAAGGGGVDLAAPVTAGAACANLCCGLADFRVPEAYRRATPGADGASGPDGTSGAACSDPLGTFATEGWVGGAAAPGSAGLPGAGGGGGGAGGGVEFTWYDGTACEFVDGLGGAGGGGGAGGCGGAAGAGGDSAPPAIGLWLRLSSAQQLPVLESLVIETEPAADGGDGGAGGDGTLGGLGGQGGVLERALLATPTLAGAAVGERGGRGGRGGAGGAGGGGCGGSSIGIWISGIAPDLQLMAAVSASQRFELGAPGRAGRGGGGAVSAAAGEAGRRIDVLVR